MNRRKQPHNPDWSDAALQRTWRSVSVLQCLMALANAFVSLISASAFMLLGTWAYFKSAPLCSARIANRIS